MAARRPRKPARPAPVLPAPMPVEVADIPAFAALRLAHRFRLSLATAAAIAEANAWGCR